MRESRNLFAKNVPRVVCISSVSIRFSISFRNRNPYIIQTREKEGRQPCSFVRQNLLASCDDASFGRKYCEEKERGTERQFALRRL